jgi:hypothetical protein
MKVFHVQRQISTSLRSARFSRSEENRALSSAMIVTFIALAHSAHRTLFGSWMGGTWDRGKGAEGPLSEHQKELQKNLEAGGNYILPHSFNVLGQL